MIATQFSSLSFLNNWRTKLVYFFLTPLIDLLLLVLITTQYTGTFNWSVGIASIAIDAARLSLQTMNELLVKDANLCIDFEMITQRPFSPRYWLSKAIVALIIGCLLAIINLFLAFCFGAPLAIIIRALTLLPLLCIDGIILGFTAWTISWQMNDPYFAQNLFSSLIELVSGILVIITAYPAWLAKIAVLFPFYGPVNLIKTGHGALTASYFTIIIWLFIGIIAYLAQLKQIRQTKGHRY
ncbi:antibiotic transporter permease [Lactobacillus sp. ESL0679]|uniref:antibiotic transporter permease n=1 Tax=Lactobacillus sp. ESL0679 TaxID=2983209 RepID=UPI0023F66006|nr:antibiotic transporter permease [Lactobacillus sp. ESL0679]MDF7683450.1 antibiotic transporter permease [Lactobacillus sp. ESL0679]